MGSEKVLESERLPFFFYGTLRPGERNYSQLLQGRTAHEEEGWWLEGVELYLYNAGTYAYLQPEAGGYQPSGAYPYMVEGKGKVAGHLVRLKTELYETMLVELDWLEGFDPLALPEQNEYQRVVREITHKNGQTTRAWVYVATRQAFERQAPRLSFIESGDWLAWRKMNPGA